MRASTLLAAALLLARCGGPGEPPAAPAEGDSAHAAIEKVASDFAAAWNADDAAGVAALFAERGDHVDVRSGELLRNRAAVQMRFAELLAGSLAGSRMALEVSSIRILEPGLALVDGRYQITPRGAAEPAVEGLYTNVMTAHGGRWVIACSRPMLPHPLTRSSPS